MFAQGLTYVDEIRGVYRVLLAVDRILAKHSPVILLQRCIRGWLLRRALTKSANQKIRQVYPQCKTKCIDIFLVADPGGGPWTPLLG